MFTQVKEGDGLSASDTIEINRVMDADLYGPDEQKQQSANENRHTAVVDVWKPRSHSMAADIDFPDSGTTHVNAYANAANDLPIGCESPLAAQAILEQIHRVTSAISGKFMAQGQEKADAIASVRALVAELRPRDGADALLAGQLIMFSQAIGSILHRISITFEPSVMVQYADAVERLTRSQLDTMRCRDRRNRPRRVAGHKITVRGHGQAVIGGVHQSAQS